MPINRNKQGTARCILTHFLPVGTSGIFVWNIRPLHLQYKGTLGNKTSSRNFLEHVPQLYRISMKLKRTEFLIFNFCHTNSGGEREVHRLKILPDASSSRDESKAFRPAGPTISRLESSLVKSPKGRFFNWHRNRMPR